MGREKLPTRDDIKLPPFKKNCIISMMLLEIRQAFQASESILSLEMSPMPVNVQRQLSRWGSGSLSLSSCSSSETSSSSSR
jgi:hypothetical protein